MNNPAAKYYRERGGASADSGIPRSRLVRSTDLSLPCEGETRRFILHEHHPVGALDSLLDQGAEIARSLWDASSLIADFDIEYVNFDRPEEAFLESGASVCSASARAADDREFTRRLRDHSAPSAQRARASFRLADRAEFARLSFTWRSWATNRRACGKRSRNSPRLTAKSSQSIWRERSPGSAW